MPLRIIHFPHPTLRYKAKPIRRVNQELRDLAAEMLELMYEAKGVGLAATQVDLPIRMFVANPAGAKGEGEEWVIINPEVQRPRGNEAGEEGCLSLPGIYGSVKRPKTIRLTGYDLKGNPIDADFDGYLGRVFQHEVDHLNGVMFIDRVSEENLAALSGPLDDLENELRSMQSSGQLGSDEQLIADLKAWEDKFA
ncbi:MAG: peptide deformylase [Planctomycetota bacterium]